MLRGTERKTQKLDVVGKNVSAENKKIDRTILPRKMISAETFAGPKDFPSKNVSSSSRGKDEHLLSSLKQPKILTKMFRFEKQKWTPSDPFEECTPHVISCV